VFNLGEQAKILVLQRELCKARSYARALSIISFSAMILIIIGCMATFAFPEFGARIGAPIIGIIGSIFFPLGAIGKWIANKTKMNLIKRLEAMSVKISACPNCKKQMLQGSFESCPFCGKPLIQ
jgi:hypothetical protein